MHVLAGQHCEAVAALSQSPQADNLTCNKAVQGEHNFLFALASIEIPISVVTSVSPSLFPLKSTPISVLCPATFAFLALLVLAASSQVVLQGPTMQEPQLISYEEALTSLQNPAIPPATTLLAQATQEMYKVFGHSCVTLH